MSTQRVALWDNARFGAIALMVAGHTLTKMVGENDAAFTLYVFIYAFHVPVFVAVSGYFTKGTAPDDRRIRSLFTDILVPYLIFEVIWSVVLFFYNGNFRLDLTRASWTLWFLLALAIWRIVLPYLVTLKYPLLISIVISLAAGYFPIDQAFSAARVLGFLPFFVFGWQLREWNLGERWMALCSQSVIRWRVLATAFMALVAVGIAVSVPFLREVQVRSFITYDSGYATFGYDQWWGGLGRLATMMLAAAMIMAFLILIPREQTWFTQFGQATMYVYLLHTFILYPLRENGVLDGERPLWYILLAVVLSFGLTVLLSTKPVVKLFKPIVQPNLNWLFVTPRDLRN
ncbi:fucose 4-O-acetylase-like acetyltransferase [Aurantimicrobium minutum]|uniref:acyltransferase family protein n=1 Tax=Aurantimicrobium minutum TaxID=708131 RepID=UPI0024753B80|nr:acyltransferase family protein [Aurantimicrobium minutum]MDH6409558.1 fucose 4-O-acetylase-like acetyltransferase [Aurantimicrobium minutum]